MNQSRIPLMQREATNAPAPSKRMRKEPQRTAKRNSTVKHLCNSKWNRLSGVHVEANRIACRVTAKSETDTAVLRQAGA